MNIVKVTNLVKFYALSLLAERPAHGYELIKEVSLRMDARVSAGQVYPFLAKLRKAGYVRISDTGDRDRKEYALTAQGRTFTNQLIARFADIVHHSIEGSVTVCAHCKCEIYRGAVKRNGKPFCCSSCAAAFFRNQPKLFKTGNKKQLHKL